MGTILHLDRARRSAPATATRPTGCKGPACPAFALCQGRCETGRATRLDPIAASVPAAAVSA